MFESSFNTDRDDLERLIPSILERIDSNYESSKAAELLSFVDSVPDEEKDAVSLGVDYDGTQIEVYFAIQKDRGALVLMFLSENESVITKIQDEAQLFSANAGV